jgi:cystathionine beta-lyase
VRNPLTELALADLRERTSIKWRRYEPDVLPMWLAEMDTLLAPPIAETLRHAIAIGDTGYPDTTEFLAAFRAFVGRRNGWDLPQDRVGAVADVMRGVTEVLKLVTKPGSVVIVNPPVYPPFYLFLEHLPRTLALAPLGPDGRLELGTLERVFAQERAAAGKLGTVSYLLCSPHNPTGTVHTRAELAGVAQLAAIHDVRVVVDEIHAPLILPGAEHTPYLSLPGTESAFALWSASKAFNLPGLKSAVVVAGDGQATDELAAMPEEVGHGPSHFGVMAQTAAFSRGEPWLDALLPALSANRQLLATLLAERLPEVGYRPPEGTYLAWLDCRGLNLPEDPSEVFLRDGRVGLHSGIPFGVGGEGHVRLTLGTPPDVLREGVARMAAAVGRT